MSQPRQPTPSHSPTPSKSSLRRPSGTQNTSQRSLLPPPSPRFEDQPAVPVRYSPRSPPNQTLEYESEEDDEPLFPPESAAHEAGDSYFPDPEPEHPFQPFFTLIEDGLTSEHHHPSVHYIFADDDTEIITEAALRSLEQDEPGSSATTGEASEQGHIDGRGHEDSRLPPNREGTREHYLILDVCPTSEAHARQQAGHTQSQAQTQSQSQNNPQPDFIPSFAVSSYTSLSSEWQVTSATITSAPTMGDTPDKNEGLMLRIEGRGVAALDDIDLPDRTGKGVAGQSEDRDVARAQEQANLEDMIERFQSRLGEVRKLIETENSTMYRDGVPLRGSDAMADLPLSDTEYKGIGLEEQD